MNAVVNIILAVQMLTALGMIGLILIQVSWINNMVLLRQEQIKHSVEESTKKVGNELSMHKGGFSTGPAKRGFLTEDFLAAHGAWPVLTAEEVSEDGRALAQLLRP